MHTVLRSNNNILSLSVDGVDYPGRKYNGRRPGGNLAQASDFACIDDNPPYCDW